MSLDDARHGGGPFSPHVIYRSDRPESMNIAEEKQSGVVVLKPQGRIDAVESPELEELVQGVIDRGDSRLVMDLSAVPYISSRGLRVILLGAKQAVAAGGTLAVCSPQVFVRKVFQSIGFKEIIDIFNTVGEAVDSLGGEAGSPEAE